MQLEIKTLANDTFTVECDADDSVRKLKEKIAAKDDLKEKYTADLLKLLYTGKVMDDEETVGSYSIKTDGFLVLVKQTPGKVRPPKPKPNRGFNMTPGGFRSPNAMSQMSSSFMQQPFQQNSFMQQPFQQNSFSQQSPFQQNSFSQQSPFQQNSFSQQSPFQQEFAPTTPTHHTQATPPESFATTEDREQALQSLLAMGFERPQAEKALRASFYNVETAVEYIMAGAIPSIDDDEPVTPQATAVGRSPGASIVQRNPPSPAASRQTGSGAGSSQLQQMRETLQKNPEQLQVLKQTLQAEHPEIAQMIDERPQDFLDLLNQAGGEGGLPTGTGTGSTGSTGTVHPPGTVTVNLSPKEQQSITRLQDMGFERNQVIEAFLACDRNEEMAANYLLSAFD